MSHPLREDVLGDGHRLDAFVIVRILDGEDAGFLAFDQHGIATPDHVLTVQTADQQRYANVLLHVGVRMDG